MRRATERIGIVHGALAAAAALAVMSFAACAAAPTLSPPVPPPVTYAEPMPLAEYAAATAPASVTSARAAKPAGGTATAGGTTAAGTEGAGDVSGESYAEFEDNPFIQPADQPLSTFAADVDTASFTNARRMIENGVVPPRGAVRIEEFVNYFGYSHALPEGPDPFRITTEVAACPWNPEHLLLMIGLRTRPVSAGNLPPANLVFLLDVSGSMDDPAKLPLVKQAFGLLASNLRARDTVSIVVYAGAAGVVLEPTPGDRYGTIMGALESLQAGGSTAGGQGLEMAYRLALKNFKPGGTNRVILATDGDFNVGPASQPALERLIVQHRDKGIFLTVLGFGTGNYRDTTMELLADKGNGAYAYIDTIAEARRALVEGLGATLLTVAKDVKLQVQFDPAVVESYRLIGYENRLLEAWEFQDDTRDAGEMGAGHSVTALYELVPAQGAGTGTWALVRARYKPPEGDDSLLMEAVASGAARPFAAASPDLRLASAVAAWGMMLRDSPHRGQASAAMVLDILGGLGGDDPGGRRMEFAALVERGIGLGIK